MKKYKVKCPNCGCNFEVKKNNTDVIYTSCPRSYCSLKIRFKKHHAIVRESTIITKPCKQG